jgi:hypothetical protein
LATNGALQPHNPQDDEAALAATIDEDNAAVAYVPERPWMRGYLVHFSQHGNQTRAAEAVGISVESVRLWRNRSDQFATAYAQAAERAADRLEEIARAWATVGLEERTVTTTTDADGKVTITEKVGRSRSPALLRTLLEATRPEKYRRNVRVEASGPGGGPIEHEVTAVDETLSRFRQELERLHDEWEHGFGG